MLNARFVKPLDVAAIVALAQRCRVVVTVEEHAASAGFGSAVLEALAEANVQVPIRCLAVPDVLVEHGDPATLRGRFGLDAPGIEQAVVALLSGVERSEDTADEGTGS